jgi:hypothetical protein
VTLVKTLTIATTLLLGALAGAGAALAQTATTPPAATSTADDGSGDMLSDLELTRAAIQVRRQAIVTAVMDLESREAEAFWPLYRDYRAAMATVNDRYVKLLVGYLETFDALTDDGAKGLLNEYMSIERARIDVKGRYVPRFGKVLPARKLARFFQIDNKLDAVIAADMARLIPLAR